MSKSYLKVVNIPLNKKKHTSMLMDEIITQMQHVTINNPTIIGQILKTWKENIKKNDIMYFANLCDRCLEVPYLQLDNEFYCLLGRYASPTTYALLIQINNKMCEVNETTLEGIAQGDNHNLFDYLTAFGNFDKKLFNYNVIQQYTLSLVENQAYNTIRSLIRVIGSCHDKQLIIQFVTTLQKSIGQVIEQGDENMINIVMHGIKDLMKY